MCLHKQNIKASLREMELYSVQLCSVDRRFITRKCVWIEFIGIYIMCIIIEILMY